jgi:hypothetical protein
MLGTYWLWQGCVSPGAERSGFDFKLERNGMAFPTSDVRLGNIPFCFLTLGRNPHATLEQCLDGSLDVGDIYKFPELAGNPGTDLSLIRSVACHFKQAAFTTLAR